MYKLILTVLLLHVQLVFCQDTCATDSHQRKVFELDPESKRASIEAEKQLLATNIEKQRQFAVQRKAKVKTKKKLIKKKRK